MPNEPVTPEEMARWAQLHFYGTFYENHGRWCAHWQANYGHPFTCAYCRDAGIQGPKSEWWTWDGFAEHMNGAHPGMPWEPLR